MEEIFVVVLQVFFEFFLQLIGSGILDAIGRTSTNSKTEKGCGILCLHIGIGGGLGWLSTFVAPNLILPNLGLRVANLILAPLVAGAISYSIAALIRSYGNQREPWSHFWHGVLFALMFGLARFAFAVH